MPAFEAIMLADVTSMPWRRAQSEDPHFLSTCEIQTWDVTVVRDDDPRSPTNQRPSIGLRMPSCSPASAKASTVQCPYNSAVALLPQIPTSELDSSRTHVRKPSMGAGRRPKPSVHCLEFLP